MKLSSHPALLCLVSVSLPLVVACGSASSGLFSGAGGTPAAEAGSSGAGVTSGGGTAHAGQSAGGTGSSQGGETSAGGGSAGQTTSGGSNNVGTGGSAGMSSGVAGHGGSTGGSSSGGSASAGTAGNGTAGTSAGGTSTGGTSSGGAGAGGAGTGGMSSGGSGGAPVCPESPPNDGDPCAAATPDNCFYPGLACSCLPDPMLQQVVRKWSCVGDGDKCPQDGVPSETSCKGMAGTICPYSAKDFCACVAGIGGNEARWQCTGGTPQTCSPTLPSGFCSGVRECAYPGPRECLCGGIGSNWECQ